MKACTPTKISLYTPKIYLTADKRNESKNKRGN